MSARRLRSSCSSRSPSVSRVTSSLLRSASTPVTPLACCSSSRSCASRDATVRDSRPSPSTAARTSSGESRNVFATVSSAVASWPVSMSSVVVARSLNASTTSYAGVVRDSGISSVRSPLPAGSRARNFCPRMVLIRTVAEVREPRSVDRPTRKSTRTWLPSRSTAVTLPTLTPAIRTSSPALSPPASESAAEYDCCRPAAAACRC